MSGFFDRWVLKNAARRWTALGDRAGDLPVPQLREQTAYARKLRTRLDRFISHAEAACLPGPAMGIERPDQCDWAWRPEAWGMPMAGGGSVRTPSAYELCNSVVLFHDCAQSELVLRQRRNSGMAAAFGISLEVFRFDGSFLSLAIRPPQGAIENLTRNHFFCLRANIATETPIEIFARLNVQHGPNTEQMLRQMDLQEGRGLAEFDLAYTNINERRLEKIWIDVIFDNPAMNRIILNDLTLTRAPRADM